MQPRSCYVYARTHTQCHAAGRGCGLLQPYIVATPICLELLTDAVLSLNMSAGTKSRRGPRSCRIKPIVMLSEDIVERPGATLRALCAAVGLPWDAAMMSWPAGPKPFDGVWAPWWYKATHASTGVRICHVPHAAAVELVFGATRGNLVVTYGCLKAASGVGCCRWGYRSGTLQPARLSPCKSVVLDL
jgi:hypothetical protein